jgi:secondary thiamine-phosphate synthase enzyme
VRQATELLEIRTARRGLTDISAHIRHFLKMHQIETGLLTLWCRHTSASLLVQEDADPEVRADLEAFFTRIAPEDSALYAHAAEGTDDMPGHIRAALTQTHLSIPVIGGALALGTWQGIYLFEHRARPRAREVVLHLIGQ